MMTSPKGRNPARTLSVNSRFPQMSKAPATPANTDHPSLRSATACPALHAIPEDRLAVVRSPIHLFRGNRPEAAADTTRYTVTGTKLIITACTTAAVICSSHL